MSGFDEWDMGDVPDAESLAASDFTPPPEGVYHLAISKVEMEPVNRKGEAVSGIELSFEILAGNVEGQAGRSFREVFYWPSPTNKDGGMFLRKRLTRLGLVTGVISPESLGTKAAVAWPDMAARHFVATIKHEEWTGEKEGFSAKIDGLKFWHVASQEVVNIPKDAEALEMIPMGADPFSGSTDTGGGGAADGGSAGAGGNGSPSPAPTPAPKPAPAAAKRTRATKTAAPAAQAPAQSAPSQAASVATATAPAPVAAATTADPYADL